MTTTPQPPRTTPSPLRSGAGIVLWLLAPITSLVVAAVGFLAGAALTGELAVAVVAAVLAGFAAGLGVGHAASRVANARGRFVPAIVAGVTTLLAVAIAAGTVFVPIDYGFTADPPPAETEFWDLPSGSRIAYLHAQPTGASNGETLIFLHGGPGTPGEGLPPGADQLAALGYEVYAYDQLGSGRSTRLDDITGYTVARQVDDLEQIRQHLGAAQLVLVGRSWGASLTAQYIARHPERVASAVFISPGPIWPAAHDGETSDPWATLPAEAHARFDDLLSTPRVITATLLAGFSPNAAHQLMGDTEADALLHASAVIGKDAGVCAGDTTGIPHNNPQGFWVNQITSEDFGSVPDPRPRLTGLSIPTLVIRGDCDFIARAIADDYVSVFANSRLAPISGAGHAVWSQAPAAYLDALLTFLAAA